MKWALALTGLIVTLAFWNRTLGHAIAPRWGALSMLIPMMLWTVRVRLTWLHLCGFVLLCWTALTLIWTPQPLDGLYEYWHILMFAAVFLVAAECPDLKPTYTAVALGIAVSAIMAVFQQYLGWEYLTSVAKPGGLFSNKNVLGELAAISLVTLIGYRIWWLIPTNLLAMIVTGGRGAAVGLGLGLVMFAWVRSKILALSMIAFGILGGWWFLPHPMADSSIAQRIYLWQDTTENLSLWGKGLGSFYQLYPSFAQRVDTMIERPEYAHNEPLNYLFELGWPGVFLLAVVGALLLYRSRETERPALVVALGVGLFTFPLHLPASVFLIALLAGRIAHDWPSLQWDEFVRGVSGGKRLFGWRQADVSSDRRSGAIRRDIPALSWDAQGCGHSSHSAIRDHSTVRGPEGFGQGVGNRPVFAGRNPVEVPEPRVAGWLDSNCLNRI